MAHDMLGMIDTIIQTNRRLLAAGRPETRQWPLLIGHTGTGKSSLARRIADQLELPMHTIILSHTLPEDVGGVLRVVRGSARWVLPDWADRPAVVFLDEIDKAPRDCVAAVLSLLTAHELRGKKLHSDTVFILAAQPADWDVRHDETHRALIARCVPMAVTTCAAYEHLSAVHGVAAPPWANATKEPLLPHLPVPSPRQTEYLLSFLADHGVESVNRLVDYLVAPEWRDQAKEWLRGGTIGSRAWVAACVRDPGLINKMTIPEVLALSRALLATNDAAALPAFAECVARVAAHAGPDEVQAWCRGLVETLHDMDRAGGSRGEVEIFGHLSAQEVATSIADAIRRGGEIRAAAIQAAQKTKGGAP